jgi:hypothetical protein
MKDFSPEIHKEVKSPRNLKPFGLLPGKSLKKNTKVKSGRVDNPA